MTTKTPSFWKGISVDRAKVYIPWLAKTCNSFSNLKITTVKPLWYGHQRDRTKCPLYRGVRIIAVWNVWFLAFLGPNELSVIERCPYYRGVRKQRLDCKNFEKGWVTFHVSCCRYVFLVHGRQKKSTAKFRKSRVRVILYTESEHTICEGNKRTIDPDRGSLFYRHEAVSWPQHVQYILNEKSTEQ